MPAAQPDRHAAAGEPTVVGLGGQRVGHMRGDAGIGQQVREPAPAVGGLEGDLDGLGLELAEDAPELGGGVADPPRQHHLTGGIQDDHV
jgi:hypothetical protein